MSKTVTVKFTAPAIRELFYAFDTVHDSSSVERRAALTALKTHFTGRVTLDSVAMRGMIEEVENSLDIVEDQVACSEPGALSRLNCLRALRDRLISAAYNLS